jgi:hypothetical protein
MRAATIQFAQARRLPLVCPRVDLVDSLLKWIFVSDPFVSQSVLDPIDPTEILLIADS